MAVELPDPTRGDVYLIELNPTRGSEIRKTRPCLVISPDELNQHLRTVIVAPMTTGGRLIPGVYAVVSAIARGLSQWTNCAQSMASVLAGGSDE